MLLGNIVRSFLICLKQSFVSSSHFNWQLSNHHQVKLHRNNPNFTATSASHWLQPFSPDDDLTKRRDNASMNKLSTCFKIHNSIRTT